MGNFKTSFPFLETFFLDFTYLFLERRRDGEREGEKHQCMVASFVPHTGDPAFKTGMCPRLGIKLATP